MSHGKVAALSPAKLCGLFPILQTPILHQWPRGMVSYVCLNEEGQVAGNQPQEQKRMTELLTQMHQSLAPVIQQSSSVPGSPLWRQEKQKQQQAKQQQETTEKERKAKTLAAERNRVREEQADLATLQERHLGTGDLTSDLSRAVLMLEQAAPHRLSTQSLVGRRLHAVTAFQSPLTPANPVIPTTLSLQKIEPVSPVAILSDSRLEQTRLFPWCRIVWEKRKMTRIKQPSSLWPSAEKEEEAETSVRSVRSMPEQIGVDAALPSEMKTASVVLSARQRQRMHLNQWHMHAGQSAAAVEDDTSGKAETSRSLLPWCVVLGSVTVSVVLLLLVLALVLLAGMLGLFWLWEMGFLPDIGISTPQFPLIAADSTLILGGLIVVVLTGGVCGLVLLCTTVTTGVALGSTAVGRRLSAARRRRQYQSDFPAKVGKRRQFIRTVTSIHDSEASEAIDGEEALEIVGMERAEQLIRAARNKACKQKQPPNTKPPL